MMPRSVVPITKRVALEKPGLVPLLFRKELVGSVETRAGASVCIYPPLPRRGVKDRPVTDASVCFDDLHRSLCPARREYLLYWRQRKCFSCLRKTIPGLGVVVIGPIFICPADLVVYLFKAPQLISRFLVKHRRVSVANNDVSWDLLSP